MTENEFIHLRGVHHSYGSTEVLADVSFTLKRGEVALLIGPNGAGKTTLFSILSCLLRPEGGEVLWHGTDIRDRLGDWKGILGVVPEGLFLFDSLTLEENLLYTAALYRMGGDEARLRAESLLSWFDLSDKKHTPAGEGSFGMRKKLSFAMALMHNPEVLLLDEALNGIDIRTGYNLRILIRALADMGKTVLMCTHNLGASYEIADRYLILHDGGIAIDIRADEVGKSGKALEDLYVSIIGSEKKTAGDLPWIG